MKGLGQGQIWNFGRMTAFLALCALAMLPACVRQPQAQPARVKVVVEWRAAAELVEAMCVETIEREASGLRGIQEISSEASPGLGIVRLTFAPEIIEDDALAATRSMMVATEKFLPQDASWRIHRN